jgi:hypothetical protein
MFFLFLTRGEALIELKNNLHCNYFVNILYLEKMIIKHSFSVISKMTNITDSINRN